MILVCSPCQRVAEISTRSNVLEKRVRIVQQQLAVAIEVETLAHVILSDGVYVFKQELAYFAQRGLLRRRELFGLV